jgi:hypothetical protein
MVQAELIVRDEKVAEALSRALGRIDAATAELAGISVRVRAEGNAANQQHSHAWAGQHGQHGQPGSNASTGSTGSEGSAGEHARQQGGRTPQTGDAGRRGWAANRTGARTRAGGIDTWA